MFKEKVWFSIEIDISKEKNSSNSSVGWCKKSLLIEKSENNVFLIYMNGYKLKIYHIYILKQ